VTVVALVLLPTKKVILKLNEFSSGVIVTLIELIVTLGSKLEITFLTSLSIKFEVNWSAGSNNNLFKFEPKFG
jgi:hypothetical protein